MSASLGLPTPSLTLIYPIAVPKNGVENTRAITQALMHSNESRCMTNPLSGHLTTVPQISKMFVSSTHHVFLVSRNDILTVDQDSSTGDKTTVM
jgi:hypothetical protein